MNATDTISYLIISGDTKNDSQIVAKLQNDHWKSKNMKEGGTGGGSMNVLQTEEQFDE